MRPRSRAATTLLLSAALLAPAGALAAADDDTASLLAVSGNGQVFVVPDVANVEIDVHRVATTATAARSSVATRTGAVLSVLARLGVPRADVQTDQISLQRTQRKRKTFYEASESVSVRLVDTTLVAPVLDGATKAGADDFSGPSFEFSDPSAGRAKAEGAALADARKRADAAAAAVGYKVVGVRSIDLDPGSSGGVVGDSAKAGTPASASTATPTTPVRPGREEVDASVRVVFVIAPA